MQSLSATIDPKFIVPLWATNPIFVELSKTHQTYERYHFKARRRNQTGPKSHTTAPRRVGITCQQLRATIGNMLNRLTLCIKYGWIGTHRPRFEVKRNRNAGPWVRFITKRRDRRRAAGTPGGGARIRHECSAGSTQPRGARAGASLPLVVLRPYPRADSSA